MPSDVPSAEDLRRVIVDSLEQQGFRTDGSALIPPASVDKDEVRKRHLAAVEKARSKAEGGLRRHQERLLERFAHGQEVDVKAFRPVLIPVTPKSEDELLFRFARLQWSIPTSAGYGRRLRFLVIDESNEKLVGLIGLGDPVFAMGPRDEWIGWSRNQARRGLHNVMDAFVLGAVPPYSHLLAGKLVALLSISAEVRTAFDAKYGNRTSLISERDLRSRLLLVTTTSALGRSSVYNRLHYRGRKAFFDVGYTRGSGEFHFADDLYDMIRRYAEENCQPSAKQERWGTGFRSRREVVRKVLVDVGLPADWLYHGLARQVFVAPLAANTAALLRGEETNARWYEAGATDITGWYRDRWMLRRASRDNRYRTFDPESLRLWPSNGREDSIA